MDAVTAIVEGAVGVACLALGARTARSSGPAWLRVGGWAIAAAGVVAVAHAIAG